MFTSNPVIYFEIPVTDLARAEKFYTAVFGFSFDKEVMDGYDMAFFPFNDAMSGITGALAKGDVYRPSKEGVILYFRTGDMQACLQKVLEQGGKIVYPATVNEKYGFIVAEFEDSEGNRIALQQIITKGGQ